MQQIDVLVADDHEILRFGVTKYLASSEDINIVGEASTGEECLALFKQHHPDVCVLDISMPEKDGIETAKELRQIDSKVKILILSMHIDKEILDKVLEADINGYLLKNTEKADLLQAIRSVMKGQQVFSDPISKLITNSYLNKSESAEKELDDLNITKREREILSLIVDGYTSQEIAKKLYISPRTVDTHRFNVMQKLDIKNTAGLVRFAIQNNLVSPE
ncbi:response regulator transcription factor [Aliifodinibius sp. S!AR15-10]|uniref:response regulator transcription factor n=1 Tax=Aliifodinibius sp. S!AR15-10 TaxID=2950437 RepID=UPI00285600B7|nr:response regulator transcription factor [Aliifodinibius sp. S!AR15-10]MDR8392089.1 response regulator transcription factor [Aliifodinibius sp. S!AR15-10]